VEELAVALAEQMGPVLRQSSKQAVMPMRFIVDTGKGNPEVLNLLSLALALKLEDPNLPIEAAGVATAGELAEAQAGLPESVGRLLQDFVRTYTPGDEASHDLALGMARFDIPDLHRDYEIREIDRHTLSWFFEALQALGVRNLSSGLKEQVEAFLTAA
jgi:hypothetical protein